MGMRRPGGGVLLMAPRIPLQPYEPGGVTVIVPVLQGWVF